MNIDSKLKLNNINSRSERAGDEPGKGALTLTWVGTIPASEVKKLFSTESSYERLIGSLWNKDGDLQTSDGAELTLSSKIRGGEAMVSDEIGATHTFSETKVDSVVVTPLPGRECEVSMKMHVYPDKDSLWFLFSRQKLVFGVKCTAGQVDIEDDDTPDHDEEVPQDGDLPFEDLAESEAGAFDGIEVE